MNIRAYNKRGEGTWFESNESGENVTISKSRNSLRVDRNGGILEKYLFDADIFFLIQMEKISLIISKFYIIKFMDSCVNVLDDGWVCFPDGSSVNAFSGSASMVASEKKGLLIKFDDAGFYQPAKQENLSCVIT